MDIYIYTDIKTDISSVGNMYWLNHIKFNHY